MRFCTRPSLLVLILLSSAFLPAKAPKALKSPILRGPVLGSPAPHSIALWVQGATPMQLRLRAVQENQQGWEESALVSEFVSLETENRLIGIFHLDGLSPDTRYRYRIEDQDGSIWSAQDASFRTPPEIGRATHVQFAGGSGANNWIEPNPGLWTAIARDQPDFFIALGDTPYADGQLWPEGDRWEAARRLKRKYSGEKAQKQLEESAKNLQRRAQEAIPLAYEYFREGPGFSQMSRQSFWVATWDDHDTGINNGDRDNPLGEIALENFKRFTPNPSFGLPDAPGAFWKLSWGNVQLFLLDDQTFRTPTEESLQDPQNATILGKRQLQWLFKELRESKAVFKILVSGSPFNNSSRKTDSWVSYPKERRLLVDEIRRSHIDGVLLLSGDVHRSEIFRLPWLEEDGGYPLYEIVSSPLFQRARSCGAAVENRIFCSGSADHKVRQLYAWFDADTRPKDPVITFQIRGLEGEVLYSHSIHASQLSWKPKDGQK